MPPCKSPFMVGHSHPVPCGQCMSCRVNRRRLWAHRMMLEDLCHDYSSWVTLTYADLPPEGSLQPHELTKFIKRIRRQVEPDRVRYFAVGEYGDETFRPHYHLMLFGFPPRLGDLLQENWDYGNVDVGEVNYTTCCYTAGYCTKKLTKKDDPRLGGRHPEFARMSNRPGLGVYALKGIADALLSEHGEAFNTEDCDVPTSVDYGNRSLPLGRYLREKLRVLIDAEEEVTEFGEVVFKGKKATTSRMAQELRDLWKAAQDDPKVSGDAKASIKHFFVEYHRQTVINAESIAKARKRRKVL